MNSSKFNMYAAGGIGALLVFLLLNFFSDLIYHGAGHIYEEPLGFAVAVEDSGGGAAEEPTEVDYAPLLASADPAAGEKVFGKCKSCHSVQKDKNGVGPSLYGIVGEKIAAAPGFSFSDALMAHEGDWDFASLAAWLADPEAFAPGTKMSFAGLPKPEDRVNVIAYLNQQSDAPKELAAPAVVPAATEAAAATTGTTTTGTAPAATDMAATGATPAAGDAANGEKVFKKCRACHQVAEGKNGVGPSLWGVVGRQVASVDGFNYSDGMKAHGGAWDLKTLDAFLADPKGVVPGTKMTFAGLASQQDRLDVITYMNEADGSPVPLQ